MRTSFLSELETAAIHHGRLEIKDWTLDSDGRRPHHPGVGSKDLLSYADSDSDTESSYQSVIAHCGAKLQTVL